MNIKPALALTVFGLLLAGFPAAAQDTPPPQQKKWDISKVDVSKLPPASDQKDLTYDKDIEPLFKASCVGCHGERRPRKDMRLDSLDAILKGGRDGKMVIPGDSKNSLLVAAAAQIDDSIAMPPKRRGPPGGGPGGPGPGTPPPGGDGGAGAPPPPGGGPGGPGGRRGPPPKPLTADQVGLIRAWIDQGAK